MMQPDARQGELFPQIRFIGIPYLCTMFNLGSTSVRELVKQPGFPPRITLVKGKHAWLLSDVENWARARAEAAQAEGGGR